MITKNSIHEITITDINNLGYGVGKIDGIVTFVAGAVTGDELSVKVIKVNKSYLVARIENIIKASEHRRADNCPVGVRCGGCVYRHTSYEHELELKRGYVKACFSKAGVKDIEIAPTRTTGVTDGYRNKAQYPVAMGKKGIEIGFFATKTHDIVNIDSCALQPALFGEICAEFKSFMEDFKIKPYDETTGKGSVRHIYLRHAKNTAEVMVCIVINTPGLSRSDELAKRLSLAFPEIKSVMLNVNDKNTNVVLGDTYKCIYGRPYITDMLCGKKFNISAGSFYQVNHDAAELLYNIAKEKADIKPTDVVLDLYCGIGTIGLSIASDARELLGVEIVDEAVECAKENAKLNGVENARFICADAGDPFAADLPTPDIVILDPPRKGCTRELIDRIAELGINKVVYISCGPDTLARDVAHFIELGYEPDTVVPVDLFPRTGHCECCVLLCRNDGETFYSMQYSGIADESEIKE